MSDVPHIQSHYPSWPLPIAAGELTMTPKHGCGYFGDRTAVFRAFESDQVPAALYQRLMDAGFRRSGNFIYQPMCPGCRRCVPIRVPVERFVPSKSQRRVVRKNVRLTVRVAPPEATLEKFRLYDRYQRQWHNGQQAGDPASFVSFLYRSPVETLEFEYRDPHQVGDHEGSPAHAPGKLLGVGICDLSPTALSSVYFYFDPDHADLSLGTYSAVYELAWAKQMKLRYWYAGYWVQGCEKMQYKARFTPYELLDTDGVWRAGAGPAAGGVAGGADAEK